MAEQSDPASDLVQISKMNGDFRRNYGPFLGAYLYLRSIEAVRQRPFRRIGMFSLIGTAVAALFARHACPW